VSANSRLRVHIEEKKTVRVCVSSGNNGPLEILHSSAHLDQRFKFWKMWKVVLLWTCHGL